MKVWVIHLCNAKESENKFVNNACNLRDETHKPITKGSQIQKNMNYMIPLP